MASNPTPSRDLPRGGPAGEVLRVLVIDESPRDRELIRTSLRGAFGSVETIEIADPAELEGVLLAGQFDLVLADHRPSWVDAFKVLGLVRDRFSYLPVILCTGTGSEELAVAAMKAGFDDYVLKHPHHFPRLATAIRAALEEATRRRIAHEEETRYQTLFEGVPVGLYRATLSGQILDANSALLRLLGFPSRESLMAVNLRDIYVDSKLRRGFLERLEREGEVHDLELSWKRYGGQIITVRKSARPVRDPSGRLLHYEGVVEDITERRRAREELQESNQFRQEIISGAGEGIVVYDRELRYIVWNRYMEQMTGLPAERVLGHKTAELFPFLEEQGVVRLLEQALAGETASSEDIAYAIPETNRTGFAVATYGPHRNAAGQIVGVIGIVNNVTERRRAEQALRESEGRFRNMADAAPVMIWMDDSTGMSTYFSKPWLDFTGRTLEQELGKGSRDGIHPEDLPRFVAAYEAAFAAHEAFQTEYRLRRADGEYRWILETAMPRFTAAGQFEGFIGSAIDIAERRLAEDTVRESEERFRFMADAAPVMIWLDEENGSVTYFSKPWLDFTGRKLQEEIGFGWFDSVHPADLERIRTIEAAARPERKPFQMEYRLRRHDGEYRWIFDTAHPRFTPAGTFAGYIGSSIDITERRLAEQALRDSEERYRVTTEAATDAVVTINEKGEILFTNAAVDRIFGYSPEELKGQPLTRLMPEGMRPRQGSSIRRYLETDEKQPPLNSVLVPGLHKDGHEVPLELSFGEFVREGKRFFTGIIRDITERQRAEEQVRAQHAFLRRVIDADPNLVFAKDWDGRFTLANHAVAEIYGTTVENLVGKSDADFNSNPGEIEHFVNDDREVMRTGRPKLIVEEQVTDSRSRITRWFQTIKVPLTPAGGGRPQVLGVATDISARKRAERLQSALYRIAATTSSAEDIDEFYVAIHGIVGELMYAKNLYVALYDPASDTVSFPYFVDEADPRPQPKHLGKGLTEYVLRTGQPLLASEEDFSAMVEHGDVELVGSWSVDWLGVPLKRGGTTFGVLVVQSYDPRFRFGSAEKEVLTFVSQQIAVALERKRAQDAVRESEERYRLLFERNLAGVYRTTLSGRILECNEALARIFGYGSREELLGRDVRTLYPSEEDWKGFRESLLQFRNLTNYEMLGQRKDGSASWTLKNVALLADEAAGEVIVEGTLTDITERKLLEEQLRQSQKMEAIGQLAGGIAHDFNNLLTTVLGYSDMALRQLSERDPVRAEIEEIQRAGERAANLTQQLLAFSRKQVFTSKVVDMNALITESTRMLGRLIGERIRLGTDLDPSLGNVRADPGQLEQVLLNLVVNARDAMPEGGTLTVRTQNADVDAASSRSHFGIAPGKYAVFSVADTGVGMDADTQKRIFEPFFTTKEKTRGAGLGLSTVYGIVSQSGGQIFVSSEPGRGTEFTVYLPREGAPRTGAGAGTPVVLRPGFETILLVEDEDAVRNLTRRLLETGGYTVLQASNAEQAMEVAQGHTGRLDMLLTDVVMPGMSGPELARGLVALRPQLRVLYVSGYPDEALPSAGALEADASFLQKPFTPETLARKIREVLDARAPASIDR
jgi:two-component system cell cycle sensor histidine kinase/response regulator CckA